MRMITLGKTGITVPQNAFGALPLQRVPKKEAVCLLQKAYDGGMRLFDTARAYTDSEEKLGEAFGTGFVQRDRIVITSKTHAKTPEAFRENLDTSLRLLKTEYIDVYQLHNVPQCYRPGDGSGMYECMLEAKAQGKIRHIGITTHKIETAFEIVRSGLYETLQFPFSYLATEKDIRLARACEEAEMGFICMKGLAGGLITNSGAAMAFMTQFNALPIWGVQRERELDEWLSYMADTPEMTEEYRAFIEKEREELMGAFCRGCGYCMPCTVGIEINNCNRMSLMLRRAPSTKWLSPEYQEKMRMIEDCVECGKCMEKCPYELKIPELLRKNYEDYKRVLAGEVSIS
ncbi:MAG: aldo/keto reductase [Eubacteriales bacterium]|nr:aldo/keto reductase [Eubacteriales bacterium]